VPRTLDATGGGDGGINQEVLWKQKIGVEFYPILKQYAISPLLKKSISDKDQLSNYHPISNHFSISISFH